MGQSEIAGTAIRHFHEGAIERLIRETRAHRPDIDLGGGDRLVLEGVVSVFFELATVFLGVKILCWLATFHDWCERSRSYL